MRIFIATTTNKRIKKIKEKNIFLFIDLNSYYTTDFNNSQWKATNIQKKKKLHEH